MKYYHQKNFALYRSDGIRRLDHKLGAPLFSLTYDALTESGEWKPGYRGIAMEGFEEITLEEILARAPALWPQCWEKEDSYGKTVLRVLI